MIVWRKATQGTRHPAYLRRTEASLRQAISEFVAHYHTERNHQGLANRLIRPQLPEAANHGAIARRQRLGGMLNYYYRAAA